jgi:uncharacterized protein YndB with AHSA1/START domain
LQQLLGGTPLSAVKNLSVQPRLVKEELMPTAPATTAAAKAEMLIRKPVEQVFEAFVDPRITTKFWFTRGSGRLEAGKQVRWDWEMYNLSVDVTVKAVEPHRGIVIEWSSKGSAATTVEWRFTSRPEGTYVSITNAGFSGDRDSLVDQIRVPRKASPWYSPERRPSWNTTSD